MNKYEITMAVEDREGIKFEHKDVCKEVEEWLDSRADNTNFTKS